MNTGSSIQHSSRVRSERLTACPLCGARRARALCRSYDRLCRQSDQSFAYARCGDCGVVYQSQRPAEDDVATFYPSQYGPYHPGGRVQSAECGVQNATSLPPSILHSALCTLHSALFRRRARAALLRAAGRVNAALNRRWPDPLPAVLDALYTPGRPGV